MRTFGVTERLNVLATGAGQT